jgi:hypothetical protein
LIVLRFQQQRVGGPQVNTGGQKKSIGINLPSVKKKARSAQRFGRHAALTAR